ncbi:hypothetical protein RI543_001817 [Arxiozyma heterogenica]|uniref:Uncharacterized protein n=1 Tax=Arxiozyma heterogenica TaxID=278026 RepID=A0AAN7WIG1_9SACH|nr:hypothetical protein RI543_001817 [Kazachstania heterogenica]
MSFKDLKRNEKLKISPEDIGGLLVYLELAIAAFATTACTVPKNGTVGAAVSFYDFILLGGTHHPRYEGKIGGVLDLAWDTGESLDDHPY